MKILRITKTFMLIGLVALSCTVRAQIVQPVKWTFTGKKLGGQEFELIFTAAIEPGWHIYGQIIPDGGPAPTSFSFTPSTNYSLVGDVTPRKPAVKVFDKIFSMDIELFEVKAEFVQRIKLNVPHDSIKGSLTYMACNDHQCIPPTEAEFSISVKGKSVAIKKDKISTTTTNAESKIERIIPKDTAKKDDSLSLAAIHNNPIKEQPSNEKLKGDKPAEHRSLWGILIAGLLGGFAAFLMPCIFPMLPLTVSYFTKTGKKGSAVGRAALYGGSIVVIYVALGLLVTLLFGADALNDLSTNGIFNLFFFGLLVVFAFSFLGAFELTLPASWGSKLDAKADQGGFLGIFFMAATLALVSFSCTGPIIGTLLVETASRGELLGPAIGMFGFSVALALPFTVFSLFPSWLQSMPKSGGWLNSVKVTLGFLELGLAMKFLSNVDLAYHWEWFDREVYLVSWIAISGLLAMYLLGKLRLSHDSEVKGIGPFRLSLAIVMVSFTLYMIPGLWGAPLKSIAAFLPPPQTQDFDLYSRSLSGGGMSSNERTGPKHKYSELFEAPYGLDAFFDLDEGLAYAKKVNKPVMIDFTGHACVNCRKMEASVWSDKPVLERLRDRYVLVQLFVDDKTPAARGRAVHLQVQREADQNHRGEVERPAGEAVQRELAAVLRAAEPGWSSVGIAPGGRVRRAEVCGLPG